MDLEPLVDSLAPRLLRYCLGHTGDRALAEEAAQDALLALVGRWRRHGPPESPEAFVFSIARRRARRAAMRRRLLQPLSIFSEVAEDEDCGVPATLDSKVGPARRAEGRSELRETLEALRCLRSTDRETLLLVAVGEMTTETAATSLGIGRSAFKMRLHRARLRLEQELNRRSATARPRTAENHASDRALETKG